MDNLFLIRKLIQGTLLNPSFLLVLIVAVGVFRAGLQNRRPSKLVFFAVTLLICPLILPIAHWLTVPLENRFQRPSLEEIEDAIDRIFDGSYGTCQQTNKPINKNRLRAVPFTRFSLEGQNLFESNNRKDRDQGAGSFATISDSTMGEDEWHFIFLIHQNFNSGFG